MIPRLLFIISKLKSRPCNITYDCAEKYGFLIFFFCTFLLETPRPARFSGVPHRIDGCPDHHNGIVVFGKLPDEIVTKDSFLPPPKDPWDQ